MVQQRKYTYQENDFLTEYHFPYKCLPVKIFEQFCMWWNLDLAIFYKCHFNALLN